MTCSAQDISKQEVWAECQTCRHRWVKAYVPMELGLFVKVCRGLCPMCGARPMKQFLYEPGRKPAAVTA